MTKLSERQRRVLGFLREFGRKRGYPPTIRDIGAACGISSTSVVNYNLNILEKAGYIRRDPEVSRGIELTDRPRREENTVPVLGYIAAGEPVPVPQADSWETPPLGFVPAPGVVVGEGVYALKVKGTSMIDALVDDGDTIIVRRTHEVRDGDVVVVWLKKEMESVLKKIFFEGDRVRLQPANSLLKPIYTGADNVEVQGKLVGVIRNLE